MTKGNYIFAVMKMKVFVRCGLVLLFAVICVAGRVSVSPGVDRGETGEYIAADGENDFEELAKLTALNGNAVLAGTAHENVNAGPFFRYLTRNDLATWAGERRRLFVPYVKYVESHYLEAFALKQDKGYYVFALREILV